MARSGSRLGKTSTATVVYGGGTARARAFSRIRAKIGEDRVTTLGAGITANVEDWISTRIPLLDNAIGRPGIPVGRVILVVGETSVGKTSLVYSLIAETQRRNGVAVYLDTEAAALSPERARILGVDPDELLLIEPATLNEALDNIETLIKELREELPDERILLILDSVAGAATEAEVAGESSIGGHARLMSARLRQLPQLLAKSNITLILVNQFRDNPMGGPFGPKKTMVAERACRFASSLTIELTPGGSISDGSGEDKEAVGIKVRADIKKSKVGRPHKKCVYQLMFDDGFDVGHSLIEIGKKAGLLQQGGGGWYSAEGVEKKFKASQLLAIMDENPAFHSALIDAIGVAPSYPEDAYLRNLTGSTVSVTALTEPVAETIDDQGEEEDVV